MANFFWIKGKRGNLVPVMNDNIYKYKGKGKAANGKTYWECSNSMCKARMNILDGEITRYLVFICMIPNYNLHMNQNWIDYWVVVSRNHAKKFMLIMKKIF